MTYMRARVLAYVRRVARRLSRSLPRTRRGHFFIWSRALLARVDEITRPAPPAGGVTAVGLDELPTRAPGATYVELEPPSLGVVGPSDWAWPAGFASVRRPAGTAPRGQGVVEIPGGVIFGARGQFGPDRTAMLADACSLWPRDRAELVEEANRALTVGLEELDGVSMSLWIGPSNYGHSLLQSVPCLDLLRRAFGLEADRFLVSAGAQPPTTEALARLGVPQDRVHVVPRANAPAYRCQQLRAATAPFLDELGIDWAADFLHGLFLPEPPSERSRRLYVPRGVARRAVLNEDEVVAVLEPAGFEVVDMVGRTVAEQASLFASAEIIVAPHGAALANLVFAGAGTTVIDLIGSNTASDAYALLAWRRGLEYHMIVGTEPAPPPRWWTWQIDADTVVDVPALDKALARVDRLTGERG
jgi:hypothetical protein